MRKVRLGTPVLLLITMLSVSVLMSANLIKILPARASPSIVLSVTSGEVGWDWVFVQGYGFTPYSSITVTYDGTTEASASCDSSGYFYTEIYYIPPSTAGPHTISAIDSYGISATATFTITPAIVLSPTGGLVGDTVTVTCTGFAGSKAITITYDGVQVAIGSSDSYGSFATSFTVPGSAGSYPVLASDSSANSASATFTVGVPGYITILNVLEGGSTLSPPGRWNYTITEEDGGQVVDTFLLAAGGGGSHAFAADPFTYYLVTAIPKYGYDTTVYGDAGIGYSHVSPVWIEEGEAVPYEEEAYLDSVDNSVGWATITFTNSKQPSFATAPVGSLPPGQMTYTPPPFTLVPIQSAWNPDKNGDGKIDLVAGKATSVLVNLASITSPVTLQLTCTEVSPTSPALPAPVTVSYTPSGTTSSVVAFPAITMDTATTSPRDVILSASYTSGTGTAIPPITVTVRKTSDLSLYYGYLHSSAYSDPDLSAGGGYATSVAQSDTFMNAAYPVKVVSANTQQNKINGANTMLKDCMAIANQALKSKYAIGIAETSTGYFSSYGKAGVVGVSYGPNVKGVVVAQDYWTAAAHEVGHTCNLYWTVPEEYYQYPLYGLMSSGVSPCTRAWRSGQDFMGCAPYKTLDNTWVDTTGTYNPLFQALTQTSGDPDIVVVSGIFHSDGSFETPFAWSKLEGAPSQILPGTYALKFVDSSDTQIGDLTYFDAQPIAESSIGVTIGQDAPLSLLQGTGIVMSGDAGFCFATLLPSGTAQIQVLDTTLPPEQQVKGTVSASQLVDVAHETTTDAYFTTADYNPIDSFECVFTLSTSSSYKMSATNPGTFSYNLHVTNNYPTDTFTAVVNVPSDFVLKPLSPGANPVLIDGRPAGYTFTSGTPTGTLTVPNIQIAQGQTATLTVRLDYYRKFQYGSPQPYNSQSQTTFANGYAFQATVNGYSADTGTIAAFGKKVTAIGGFLTDVNGVPKGGLTVTAYSSGNSVGTNTSTADGFYFITLPAGTYTLKCLNAVNLQVATASNIKVSNNQFVEQDFSNLNPADPAINGFVKDTSGKGVLGVTVQLLNKRNSLIATATTNLGGYYVFRFSAPGSYTVKIIVPSGYTGSVTSTSLTVKQFETDEVDFNLKAKT